MAKKEAFRLYYLILMACLMLACSSQWAAGAKELHDAWHFSGDTFTVEGEVITVTHLNFYDTSVMLGINKYSYIIEKGNCEVTLTREYCITDIFNDLDADNESAETHLKFEGGEAYAGILITIYTRGPEMSISRTFSTATPELYGEITVNVTLENKGKENPATLLYSDAFPKGVDIASASTTAHVGIRNITFDTIVPALSKKSFTYKLKVNEFFDFSSFAVLNYTYEGATYGFKSATQSIKVQRPYALTVTLNKSTTEASDNNGLNIKIENKISYGKVNVSELIISLPAALVLSSTPPELVKKDDRYYWKGLLDVNSSKTLNLGFRPSKSGTYKTMVEIRAREPMGKDFYEIKNSTVTVTIKPIEPIISVRKDTVAERSSYRLAFSLKNPNLKVSFKNIAGSVKNDLLFPEKTFELAELLPNTTETIFVDNTLISPQLDAKKAFDIIASGRYETSTRELMNFTKKGTLTVTPVAEIINIVQESDKKEVIAGQNATITVKITNNNKESIQVDVADAFPDALSVLGGKTSDTLMFYTSGTQQAYTYKLFVPINYDSGEIMINTSAAIPQKDYITSKNMSIKVKAAEVVKENTTQPVKKEEPAKPAPQPIKTEPKVGFFQKVLNAISGFFRRLLGNE